MATFDELNFAFNLGKPSDTPDIARIVAAFNLDPYSCHTKGGATHIIFPATKEKLVVGEGGMADIQKYRVTLYGVSKDPRKQLDAPGLPAYQHDDDIDYTVIGFLTGPHLEPLLCRSIANLRANRDGRKVSE